jgi:hypothetical protein
MLRDSRKSHKITDLLTPAEIDRAMILLLECKKTKKDFNQRCATEVVEPVMSRVKAHAGYNDNPESLVYRLERYLRSVAHER